MVNAKYVPNNILGGGSGYDDVIHRWPLTDELCARVEVCAVFAAGGSGKCCMVFVGQIIHIYLPHLFSSA